MGFFSKKSKPEKKVKSLPSEEKNNDFKVPTNENNGIIAIYMAIVLEQTARGRALKALSISLALNILFACIFAFVLYYGVIYKQNVYFATTIDGRIQELPPYDEPYVSNEFVSEWTAETIIETYNLDFRNYRKMLARVRPRYSVDAWREIEEQIRPLVDSVLQERLIISATVDGVPEIIAEGVGRNGCYYWELEFPLTLSHELPEGIQVFRWSVRVFVERANVMEKPSGLEIIRFTIRNRSK